MIKRFYNLSLQRKQMVIIMLISTAALLLTCVAFVTYDALAYRRELVEKVSSLADVVGNKTTAAIDFNDPAAANQTLAALRGEANITIARVHKADGETFASYARDGIAPSVAPLTGTDAQHEFKDNELHLFRPIIQGNERVGTIELVADLGEFRRRLWRYAGIVAIVFVGSLVMAFYLSLRLGRVISQPVHHLAEVVRSVAREKNYSVRATKQSEDELGELIDGFNEMLTQIQQRDGALQAAQETLELRVAERTQELAGSLSLLNATLDSTTDGILAVQFSGAVVCHNSQFATMWGIPIDGLTQWPKPERQAFLAAQVKDSEAYLTLLRNEWAAPETETFNVIEMKDGRIFERYVRPQRIDGRCIGRVTNCRDITARKQSEAALAKAHKEIVKTSRQAGMAEVATGVLHNVGNVLNSVNVGASCIADGIRKSKAVNLAKVVALLREHEVDLGDYLTRDEKGKQVPGYLAQLAEHLAGERNIAQNELAELQRHIDHIKEIVAMQQNYATLSGVKEALPVTELVEDALRLNASSLTQHRVRVIREFTAAPVINIEKHKAMQILVNLMRNAKQSCDAADRDDKRMTLRIMDNAERICISVIDNGVGIATENLTRIFNQGFTTKKEGHGFGLHNAANAATEMGGALTVHSDGPGTGATFTLELPLDVAEPKNLHKKGN